MASKERQYIQARFPQVVSTDIRFEKVQTQPDDMPTPNKSTESQEVNFNALLQAIKCCIVEQKSIRLTAHEHDLDKSTLQRYVNKVKANYEDILTVEKNELMEFIQTCSRRTPSNMQKKLGLKCPTVWNEDSKAGRTWYYLFMKRHPELKLRTAEQTSIHRVKAFCKDNVDKFFENLGRLLDEFHFDSTSIYNMDESGFSNVPTKIGKVIALKGMKRIGKVEAAERDTMITLALTVIASGNSIPPFFLFPRKKMQTCFLDNVSCGTAGFANDSSWMAQSKFCQYIRHFIKFVKPSTDSPVLLLLDNHSSHLSVDALDIAVKHGIHILSFPPHCSHKLQPLDVSVFGPTKAYYKSQCSTWQKNNANKVLEIKHIAGLVCAALDSALTSKTIKSGFAATGISPFNPDIFSDADFVQAVQQNAEEAAIEADLNENNQRRIIVVDPLNVVCDEAIVPETIEPTTSRGALTMTPGQASILDEIGPLQAATPKKPSNRGRKAMKSCELTSPENIAVLKEKAAKKAAEAAKKEATATRKKRATTAPKKTTQPVKRFKTQISPRSADEDDDDDDADFCILCLKLLPKKLTAFNSIQCNSCERPVHLKCANMRTSFLHAYILTAIWTKKTNGL
ncbi:PREDICTED: uncharacterized protein LOC108774189 [Cyphomyrmex costatus]|uniref:uncharacterized protein LOC108774189 n=1 Tax=Cyphomyrmex costatus TaxID=456900 RepID=UPI0008522AE2|nr:PREDICTED: uncharacterized protein LOC108774189 [Cyphomyrmex costatus]